MRIQSKIILFILSVIIVTGASFTALLLKTQIQTLEDGVSQTLLTSARMIKAVVPFSYHDRISSENSVSPEQYREIVDQYNQLCKDLDLQYLWSVMQVGDTVRFTSATSPGHDVIRGGHAEFFSLHSDPEYFDEAFKTMKPVFNEFENEWGRGRAVLLPYKDMRGRKYVYGASMSVQSVDKLIHSTIMHSLSIGLVILFAGLLVSYYFGRTMARPLIDMADFAGRAAKEGPGQVVDVHGSTEFETLAENINVMSKGLERREQAVKRERNRLLAFMANAPAMIYVKDTKGRYLVVNDEFLNVLGVSNNEVIRRTDANLFPEDVAANLRQNDLLVLESGVSNDFEETVVLPNGKHVVYFSTKFILQEKDGVNLVCGISIDMSARKAMEERLRLARQAIETVSEAILITNADGVILDVNPAFTEITGFSPDVAIGKTPRIGKSGHHDDAFYVEMWRDLTSQGSWEGEIWDRRANGEIYPKWLSITSIRDDLGKITHYVGIFQDISKEKKSEETLHNLAFYDPLTGLPNRALFHERLGHEIDVASRTDSKLALLFIDLDRFKYVNDSLGHSVGDQLLVEVSKRLLGITRQSDTVARLGGDEFTIILLATERPLDAQNVAQKVIEVISEPYRLDGHDIFLEASVGIVMYPDDAFAPEHLVRCADLAMYKAKDAGRGSFAFFRPELTMASNDRLALEADMRHALANQEFEVYYQPKVEIDSGKVVGMEALVRWIHPQRGLIPPDAFIPMAEETGLILPLGQFVMETACRQTQQWREDGYDLLRVAVNLSALQFEDSRIIESVARTLDFSGLESSGLEIEITESVIMKDANRAVETIQQFANMGVHVSIDDFGTGYSSLAYLKQFPLNSLKVDRSFIKDLENDSDDRAIVRAVCSLAESLRLCVVAEGVETDYQLDFLREMHCQIIQGYYFSKPLPAAEFEAFMKSCGVTSDQVCILSDQE